MSEGVSEIRDLNSSDLCCYNLQILLDILEVPTPFTTLKIPLYTIHVVLKWTMISSTDWKQISLCDLCKSNDLKMHQNIVKHNRNWGDSRTGWRLRVIFIANHVAFFKLGFTNTSCSLGLHPPKCHLNFYLGNHYISIAPDNLGITITINLPCPPSYLTADPKDKDKTTKAQMPICQQWRFWTRRVWMFRHFFLAASLTKSLSGTLEPFQSETL